MNGRPNNAFFVSRFLAAALLSTSGCWCTHGVWGWANQPAPRSEAYWNVELEP